MQARSVSLGAMFAWIPATFTWFGRQPATLLGASGILLLVFIAVFAPMYAVMFASMPAAMAMGNPSVNPMAGQSTLFWVLYAASIVVSMIVLPPVVAGWFRLARDVDAGVDVSAKQVLKPYRDRALWGRSIAFGLLAMLIYLAVMALFFAALYQPLSGFMAQVALQQAAVAAGQPPPSPDFPFVLIPAYFLFLGTMLLMQFVYFLGFAEVALRPTSALAALRLAFAGVLRNLLKLALLMLVLSMGMMVVMMVVVLVMVLVMMVLMMIHPWLGVIGMLALYVPVILVMYPLMFGGNYFVWKDMFGEPLPDAGVDA